jgi:hypothetical protein
MGTSHVAPLRPYRAMIAPYRVPHRGAIWCRAKATATAHDLPQALPADPQWRTSVEQGLPFCSSNKIT